MRIKFVGIITSSIIHIQSYLGLLQNEAKLVISLFFLCQIKKICRIYLSQSPVNYDRLKGLLLQNDQPMSVSPSIYVS